MKNLALKKSLSILLGLATLICCLSRASCKEDNLVIKDSDTFIVIKATQDSIGDKTDMKLIDYMQMLKADGKLEFEINNGMITSINGYDNPADYSKCWMLYTSDSESSSTMYGTVEYDGTEYGSAMLGAESLTVKAGETYIWVFKSF